MAASGTIWGSFSGESSDRVRPYVTWAQSEMNATDNTSLLTLELYFTRVNTDWWGAGTSYGTYMSMNSSSSSSYDIYFNLTGDTVTQKLLLVSWRISHCPDGTANNLDLRAVGETNIYWGSFDFTDSVNLTANTRDCAVSTSDASSVEGTSATVGGNVTDAGLPPCSSRGIYWGTSSSSQPNKITSGSGAGSFTASMSSLSWGTTYYFKAYAYNTSYGYRYGAVKSFTTLPGAATLTSSASFTAGNNIYLTFTNPSSMYVKARLYVHDGGDYEPKIVNKQMGQVSSGTITFTQSEINAIFTQLGSNTSRTSLIRLYTYSDSGYSDLIDTYKDKAGTCSQPSRATTSSNANLTIGNDKTITVSNPSSKYVRCEYWINGNAGWYKVKDDETGTSGHTFSMSSTDNDNMYSRMPNVTSASAFIRIYTYEHSDYTTQIRDYYQTATGTVSIDQTSNKPDFTTFTVGNVDKTVDNVDKYSNTLVSSSTSTLLGADTKMIKGYSKLRAVITSANKMVAQNYATASKYIFTSGSKYKEESYSSSSTVNLDIDNANEEDVSVTAYDSRSLTTTVNDTTSITNNAEYEAVSLWGLTLVRDNGVDSETKLQISGSYWNEYFGGGTSGVLNSITCEYRYKETTESWDAQEWEEITLTDTDGELSYDDYIDGDLGVSGFDTEKSFDIEVRLYDDLTNTIVEETLSVGTPVMDITSDGIAIKERYDDTEGGVLQILGKNILNVMYPVGSIYTNYNVSTNPATLMGFGTWSAVAEGRVLVGKAGSGTFGTINATGGAENVTLTTSQMPSHTHTGPSHRHSINARGATDAAGYGLTVSGIYSKRVMVTGGTYSTLLGSIYVEKGIVVNFKNTIMKSEVIKITERNKGEYKQIEFILKVENDDGEILPEYLWVVNPERTKEILESEDEMKEELAIATSEALDYIQRDKSMVQNPVIEEKELDLKKVLTTKVKGGLTKEGIQEYKEKEKEGEKVAEDNLTEETK